MTLTAVSFERFVAVRFPSIYTTFFSRKRILEYVIGIWTVNILLSALQWVKINQEVRGTQLILCRICLFISQQLRLDYHSLCDDIADNFKHNFRLPSINLKRQREAKLSKEISLVARVYLILNFPVLLVTFYHQILGLKLGTYNFYSWAEKLAVFKFVLKPIHLFLEKSTNS